MNKLVKGSIAGAAGIALLLGGAGSLALWNADADIASAGIESGTLTLAATAGTWSSEPDLWVPGDSFTYASTLTIGATGDNLTATLSVDKASIATGALASALDIVITPDAALPAGITDNADGTFDVAPAAGNYTVPVTVTVTFDENADDTTQAGTVDLASLQFVLQQYV
ncbi:MAG: alternate-type signal peptide domain-containing protein [Homoserinimonas sp.]